MATARRVLNPNLAASKQALTAGAKVLDALGELRRVVAEQNMMLNGESAPNVGAQAALEYGMGTAAEGLDVCTIYANALTAFDVPAVRELARIDQG